MNISTQCMQFLYKTLKWIPYGKEYLSGHMWHLPLKKRKNTKIQGGYDSDSPLRNNEFCIKLKGLFLYYCLKSFNPREILFWHVALLVTINSPL